MRLATARHTPSGRVVFGAVVDDGLVDLSAAVTDQSELISMVHDAATRPAIDAAVEAAARVPLDELTWLPPMPNPRRIMCVGTNYADHVAESDRISAAPDHPVIFTRFPSSLVGHGDDLVRPSASTSFDYEGELGIVIGQTTRHATQADALSAIGGFTCFMDGTLRDWQRHTSQFLPGKSFERSGAMGPWVVTADEIADPYALTLTTRVDGEVMQHASTSQLIHDLTAIIVYCSTFTTLEPGDVIATGTPGGVGYARDPQVWLVPGSRVEVDISGVGVLANTVVDEPTR